MAIRYVTHEGKAYQQAVREQMLNIKAWHYSEHPLELCVLVCFKDNRVQDISNRLKVLEDALKVSKDGKTGGNVYTDDSQIETIEMRRGPNCKIPYVKVTCREILPDRMENLRWINER